MIQEVTIAMDLKRRVAKLEDAAVVRQPPEPVFSEQDLAIMQRIVERTYADPVRYASRIALFERCRLTGGGVEDGAGRAAADCGL